MYYQNVRGLRTKTSEAYSSVLSDDYDIIVFTETWLTVSFHDSEIFDKRYTVLRRDRNDHRRGGGVLVAAKTNLCMQCVPLNIMEDSGMECLLVKMKINRKVFYLCSVYFVPNLNVDMYVKFYDTLENILDNDVDIVILGDFNLPLYDIECCDKSRSLNSFISYNNLKQFNTIHNRMGRKLDLVISNMSIANLQKCNCPILWEDDHHPSLNMTMSISHKNIKKDSYIKPQYVYDYSHGDFYLLYQLLSNTDWSNLQLTEDINDCTNLFYEKVISCLNQAIPKRAVKTGNHRGPEYPNYFSTELKKNIKLKNRLHRQARKENARIEVINKYKMLRHSVKNQTAHEILVYHQSIENNANIDPNGFWDFVRSKRGKPGIPIDVRYRNHTACGAEEVADAFALYFSSVFQQSTEVVADANVCKGNFHFSEITDEQVKASIKKLKPKKACGNDNIPAYIYKGCSDILCVPLTIIFNLCIKQNKFPDRLKYSTVTPIFKAGDVNSVDNYRPISVLNSMAKIFENILHSNIMDSFVKDFAKQQHGFLPDVSTVTNLCLLTEAAANAVDSREQLDVVMTDCAKAFDTVDHGLLITKLGKFGFSVDACRLINSYLTSRPQQVKVGNCMSNVYMAASGVPQGSNLGPLLFAIFINDLPNCIRYSESLMFADDFKLFKHITSSEDCQELQSDVNSVFNWFCENRMTLNISKCQVLTFTRKLKHINFDYTINDLLITRKKECKDLGVHLQTNLKFTEHIENVVNKSYRLLGFVIRNTKNFKNINTIIKLYNALVRPTLEYASVIWSPQAATHCEMIEKVQKRFLRYLYLKTHNIYPFMISYNSMLIEFNVVRLRTRRKLSRVLFIYNIIHNLRYRKCCFINQINFLVPKINLRIRDNRLFFCLHPNSSPINNMLHEANLVIQKCDIDLLNISVKQIKRLILNSNSDL